MSNRRRRDRVQRTEAADPAVEAEVVAPAEEEEAVIIPEEEAIVPAEAAPPVEAEVVTPVPEPVEPEVEQAAPGEVVEEEEVATDAPEAPRPARKRLWLALIAALAVTVIALSMVAFLVPRTITVEKQVPIEKVIKETVVVEKQVLVEKIVKETVIVKETCPPTPTPTATTIVVATPTTIPAKPTAATILFGEGFCQISGKKYQLSADPTAIWMDRDLLTELWKYGGSCEVKTNKPGWFWSIAGTISRDGKSVGNGNSVPADPGNWIISYPTPPGQELRINYGFAFRDNVPPK